MSEAAYERPAGWSVRIGLRNRTSVNFEDECWTDVRACAHHVRKKNGTGHACRDLRSSPLRRRAQGWHSNPGLGAVSPAWGKPLVSVSRQ